MVIYKKCYTCHQFFESTVGIINSFCPAHQEDWKRWILGRVHARMITVDSYDIYEKVGDHYYHVCRNCGAPILTKAGKRWSGARSCRGPHKNPAVECKTLFWSWIAKDYLYNLLDQQQFRLVGLACKYHRELRERIGLLPEAKMSVHPSYSKLIQEYVICEECGKLISRYVLNIHHKIPVSLLTYENWQLAFDPQNLIGLCHECHKTKHGEVHKLRGLKLSKDYHKMQAYLYAKNNKKSSKSLKITDFIGVKKP